MPLRRGDVRDRTAVSLVRALPLLDVPQAPRQPVRHGARRRTRTVRVARAAAPTSCTIARRRHSSGRFAATAARRCRPVSHDEPYLARTGRALGRRSRRAAAQSDLRRVALAALRARRRAAAARGVSAGHRPTDHRRPANAPDGERHRRQLRLRWRRVRRCGCSAPRRELLLLVVPPPQRRGVHEHAARADGAVPLAARRKRESAATRCRRRASTRPISAWIAAAPCRAWLAGQPWSCCRPGPSTACCRRCPACTSTWVEGAVVHDHRRVAAV